MRPWLKTLRRKEELIVEFVSEVMEGLGWKNKWEKGFLYKKGTTTFWGLQLLIMYLTSWAVGGVLSVQLGMEAHTCRLKYKDHSLSLWVQDQPGQDFVLKQRPCFVIIAVIDVLMIDLMPCAGLPTTVASE